MDEACRGQTVKEDNKSEDLLSSSTFDQMDQSAVQSRKSISSVGTSTQPSDPQTSSGSQIDHPEFVNHGKFADIFMHMCLIFDLLYISNS